MARSHLRLKWYGLSERAQIVDDGPAGDGRCLRMAYPKAEAVPNETGGRFWAILPPADSSIRFDNVEITTS